MSTYVLWYFAIGALLTPLTRWVLKITDPFKGVADAYHGPALIWGTSAFMSLFFWPLMLYALIRASRIKVSVKVDE